MALEHSMRSRASIPVEVERICASKDPKHSLGGWRTEQWPTPWTALRWAVPELCGWRGRAIYFDCPSLVLVDIAYLEQLTMPPGAFLLARREGREMLTSCLVFDCAEARKHLPRIVVMKRDVGAHQEVGALLARKPSLVGALPEGWGWSDVTFAGLRPGESFSGSVHFQRPPTQPHGPLADARLRLEGREHWFRGVRLPHYCERLRELWREEYVSSIAAAEGLRK